MWSKIRFLFIAVPSNFVGQMLTWMWKCNNYWLKQKQKKTKKKNEKFHFFFSSKKPTKLKHEKMYKAISTKLTFPGLPVSPFCQKKM